MKTRDANEVYRQAVATANKERDAKVRAAVDSAVKDAEKTGRDPIVARRNATTEARRATRADFDAAVSAARKERSAARAAAAATARSLDRLESARHLARRLSPSRPMAQRSPSA